MANDTIGLLDMSRPQGMLQQPRPHELLIGEAKIVSINGKCYHQNLKLSNQVKHKPVVSAEERSDKQENRSKEIIQNVAQRDKGKIWKRSWDNKVKVKSPNEVV